MGRRNEFKKKFHGHHDNRNSGRKPFNRFDKSSNKRRFDKPHEQKTNTLFSSLKEDQVGITEYVRDGSGFTGIIKARYSDFHVNEIDFDGKEVKLTDLTAPVPEEDSLGKEMVEKNKVELAALIPEATWTLIREIIKGTQKDEQVSVDIDVTDVEKDKRTLIHKTLKGEFGSAVVTTTAAEGEKKLIKCFRAKGHKEAKRTRWCWPGEYVYFVVHKSNTDTVRAAADLANGLRLKPSLVNYAGTKDKRAKTTQWFCVKKRDPEDLVKAAKFLKYMQIGNFTFKDQVLKLGNLKGNRFRIAIRQVSGDEAEITNALNSIKENGFINYYGLQRFGNCSGVPTFDVGIALLKSDYKEACELILKPRDGEPNFMKNIRELWWKNRNSAEAASKFYDDNKFIEKKLLDGLAQYGENDYANALHKIPRNMLLLYTHSYQSLIWNQVASRRIKEFGLKLIPGDLVYTDSVDLENEESIEVLDEELAEEGIDGAPAAVDEETDKVEESKFKTMVKPLTADDIATDKYTIFDIVLPLPGHDITYPSNEVGKWYDEILAEKDLTSDKLKHNVKTYSLTGAYRKLLVKPTNMSWEFKTYKYPTSNLIISDIEELKGDGLEEGNEAATNKALILDFCLPSAAYATMALREILKTDTSVESQQKLADELEAENKNAEEVDTLEKDEKLDQCDETTTAEGNETAKATEDDLSKQEEEEDGPSDCKKMKSE